MLMNRTTPFMVPVDDANPAIIKNEALCSECGHCFAVCEEEIGVAAKYLLNQREAYQCIGCGQCSAVCPEKAITGRPHYKIVKELIKDPEKIVVFSTSPSVRVGFADGFGKEPGTFAQDEMVGALRALGADYVFDVTFSADLTIMEEGSELLSRILKGTGPLPQFTSCCPAWVKYMENFHPDKTAHLSSAKSPIGMQGAVIKTYFAHKKHIDPEKIISVAVTPCTAKKAEIAREELCDAGKLLNIEEMRDNDYVITTKELVQWCQEEGLDLDKITPSKFDSLRRRNRGRNDFRKYRRCYGSGTSNRLQSIRRKRSSGRFLSASSSKRIKQSKRSRSNNRWKETSGLYSLWNGCSGRIPCRGYEWLSFCRSDDLSGRLYQWSGTAGLRKCSSIRCRKKEENTVALSGG